MERETLNLENYTLAILMEWSQEDEAPENNIIDSQNYELISEVIDQHDEYDGGSYYTTIIKRISDNKFFKFNYQDWDYDWEKGDFENFKPQGREVFPEIVETVIYK